MMVGAQTRSIPSRGDSNITNRMERCINSKQISEKSDQLSMNFMSNEEIRDSLISHVTSADPTEDFPSLAWLRSYWSPNAQHFTYAMARRAVGKSLLVLMGQSWWDLREDHSGANRMDKLEVLQIIGADDEWRECLVKDSDGLKFCISENDGCLTSGSGNDELYVFIAVHSTVLPSSACSTVSSGDHAS